jgi:hypothetical protein
MAQYCQSIENFKSALTGGGVRPTMFMVDMKFPNDTTPSNTDPTNLGRFLIKAASIPEATVGTIAVPFRGRKLKVAGDRDFPNWTVTVLNDNNFRLRMAFEEWSEKISGFNYTCGTNNLDNYFSMAQVKQLDRDGYPIRSYEVEGIWPTSVAPIDLDFEAYDQIETYQVTFAMQYWCAAEGDSDPSPYTNWQSNRTGDYTNIRS